MNWSIEFEKYKTSFEEDLRGLIAIPSVKDMATATQGAPFGESCREALEYMLKLGESYGFTVHNYDGYAGVIAYGEGEESVGLLAHLDVVPQGEGWTKEAFALSEEQGFFFGRGVLDDKGAAMAGLYALRMLCDQQVKLHKKILIILGCDEESGSACMKYYRKHGEIPVTGFTPDANFPVIYGEKGGMHVLFDGYAQSVIKRMQAGERANIVIGKACAVMREWDEEKADLFAFYLKSHGLVGSIHHVNDETEIMIEGTFAHAAMPYYGVNAALHILNFVGSAYQDHFAQTTYALLQDWQGKPLGIDMEGVYMGFLTMNTGIVDLREDGQVKIVVDIRYPNDTNACDIYQKIKDKAIAMQYELDVILDDGNAPLFVDPSDTLVQKLQKAYQTYTGDMFTPGITIGGGTYAREFDNFLAFGPAFPNVEIPAGLYVGSCHQCDEGIKKDDLYCAAAIYTQALEDLAREL